MSRDTTIEVLNELIRTSEDGRRGFEAAAEKADDPRLKSTFAEHARSCAAAVSELQQLVHSFGGKPVESGSIAGAAHRGWVRARAAAGDNNVAVLEEVERGEDVAKATYTRALQAPLPADVRALLERQYHGVLRNHDSVRGLRNQYRAGA